MKIAIHHRGGSFSDRWIKYCENNNIEYKIVNCFDSNIIEQISDCDGFMWHWAQWDSKAILFAKPLIMSLEKAGKNVYPNSKTSWHFDDKVGQKYLFEALKIKTVPTWIFYDKKRALEFVKNTSFPKVFKLRGGSSSENVKLVKSPKKAKQLIKIAFGKGFEISDTWNVFNDWVLKFERNKSIKNFIHILKGLYRLLYKKHDERLRTRDKGYVYFQEFIPGNKYDVRLVVIGDYCFGLRRFCRKNDFRASGSGLCAYEPELFDKTMIKTAFDISRKLDIQSVALDFLHDVHDNVITEISYCFTIHPLDNCLGYWDTDLQWHKGNFNLQEIIIKNFIKSIDNKRKVHLASEEQLTN